MAEEFQESDVIFSDHGDGEDSSVSYRGVIAGQMQHNSSSRSFTNKNKKIHDMVTSTSLPVKIPAERMLLLRRYRDGDDGGEDQLEEEWDDEERVPPHIIVGRRVAGKMAFSVCTGNGRTLKGRDLRQVRNSILRMTGFLES